MNPVAKYWLVPAKLSSKGGVSHGSVIRSHARSTATTELPKEIQRSWIKVGQSLSIGTSANAAAI
jgi:hypothetical protein